MLHPNRLKAAFASRELQIGLWCCLSNSYTTELLAGSGYDWLSLDLEHSPNDMLSILGQLQMLAAYPLEPVVRPSNFDRDVIKQYLDLGARTLVLPNVESAEQARAIVASTRYPGGAGGIRGVAGLQRANRWGRVPNYHREAERELCVIAQIESLAGVENAKAIASVEGIDGVFVGPSDLAASMGFIGRPSEPAVQDAIVAVQRLMAEIGKGAGILAALESDARRYAALGYTMVGLGSDQGLLVKASDDLVSRFRQSLVS